MLLWGILAISSIREKWLMPPSRKVRAIACAAYLQPRITSPYDSLAAPNTLSATPLWFPRQCRRTRTASSWRVVSHGSSQSRYPNARHSDPTGVAEQPRLQGRSDRQSWTATICNDCPELSRLAELEACAGPCWIGGATGRSMPPPDSQPGGGSPSCLVRLSAGRSRLGRRVRASAGACRCGRRAVAILAISRGRCARARPGFRRLPVRRASGWSRRASRCRASRVAGERLPPLRRYYWPEFSSGIAPFRAHLAS